MLAHLKTLLPDAPCCLNFSWQTFHHRKCHFATLPWQLLKQPWEDRDNSSGEWKDIEAGVHPLWCSGLWWYHYLLMWLCQDHGWGQDDLDGQELRLLLRRSIWFRLLPAVNHNDQKQQSEDILQHRWRSYKPWLESHLECSDTRSEDSHLRDAVHLK